MNKTYGDMMSEYEQHRVSAQRFSVWEELDKYVENLVKQIALKVDKAPMPKFQDNIGFDDMGTPVHKGTND